MSHAPVEFANFEKFSWWTLLITCLLQLHEVFQASRFSDTLFVFIKLFLLSQFSVASVSCPNLCESAFALSPIFSKSTAAFPRFGSGSRLVSTGSLTLSGSNSFWFDMPISQMFQTERFRNLSDVSPRTPHPCRRTLRGVRHLSRAKIYNDDFVSGTPHCNFSAFYTELGFCEMFGGVFVFLSLWQNCLLDLVKLESFFTFMGYGAYTLFTIRLFYQKTLRS